MGRITTEKGKTPGEPPARVESKPEKPEVVEKAIARRRRPFELLRRMFQSDWDPFESMEPLRAWPGEAVFAPDFTVKETKEAFVFRADIPGIEERDLDVSVTQNRLTVSGRREEEKKEEGDAYYAYERSFGSFSRSFTLPPGADVDKVNGELKDGVLTVTIPKLAEAQAKKVDIKGA